MKRNTEMETGTAPATSTLETRRRGLLAALAATPALIGAGAVQAQEPGRAATLGARPAAGRVAIVTGSSRGIGAATAKRLARDGHRVVVNYEKNQDLAAEVVREIEAAGGQAIAVQADVSDPRAVARLFDAAERSFGGVDVVVANAGVMRLAPFRDMTDADFDRMWSVNGKGSFNTLREAARRVRDGGRIVAISSSITQLRTGTYGPYAATKMAQDMFVGCLAKELEGRHIAVNAVAPGVVNTPLFTDGKSPQMIAGFAQRTPMKRLGEPSDIADVIAALSSRDGLWINGQTAFANGGLV